LDSIFLEDLNKYEKELKKRLPYPYVWGRKQNDYYNGRTDFIYKIFNFDKLLEIIDENFLGREDYKDYFNYSINRWFNFWSAMAVEKIFCSFPSVTAEVNSWNKLVDFEIQGIKFDHKTSVFPRRYPKSIEFALDNHRDLINWLYENQSQQQRKHLKNRLFIVLYDKNGSQWKLRAEIIFLRKLIEKYVNNFDEAKLLKFSFKNNEPTLSDIIWAIK